MMLARVVSAAASGRWGQQNGPRSEMGLAV